MWCVGLMSLAVILSGLSLCGGLIFTGLRKKAFPRVVGVLGRRKFSQQLCSEQTNLSDAARDARGLCLDAVLEAKSGHLGLPLGCSELGAVLWGREMTFNPHVPEWLNRDRFVLSAGHGSIFLYTWLHLAGFNVSMQDIQAFRKMGSNTPGHPEFSRRPSHLNTPGVEATTGPLGTGVGNAVGMAMAAKMSAARYNTPKHSIFDHKVYCLCGDGCMQEGVTFEAVSLAAHHRLDNLCLIYDSNDVTLDNPANLTQSEDHAARFRALGWRVLEVNGNDLHSLIQTFDTIRTKDSTELPQPTLVIAKTVIGKGVSAVEGTVAAHGNAGAKHADSSKKDIGVPSSWFVSESTKQFFQQRRVELKSKYERWMRIFEAWSSENESLASELQSVLKLQNSRINVDDKLIEKVLTEMPSVTPESDMSTRQSCGLILQHLPLFVPGYVSGSADLHSSCLNHLQGAGTFGHVNAMHPGSTTHAMSYAGRNILFGVREHAMGAIANGFCYYGLHQISISTFLSFSDYLRPTIRIAAMSGLPVTYLFTHDSVAVGEDGPTHQPVECAAALRAIPNLCVIRPADSEEVVGALATSVAGRTRPTAILLSRQSLPQLSAWASPAARRRGVLRGAYTVLKEEGYLTHIVIATGSEVSVAVQAALLLRASSESVSSLGLSRRVPGVRVVSMPCTTVFDEQDEAYRNEILPRNIRKRLVVEAGTPAPWYKYAGLDGAVLGIDQFGMSADGKELLNYFGFTPENISKHILAL